MDSLGPLGVVLVAVSLLSQVIIAIFATRNRRGDAAWRWRKRMEPVHLDLLDWASSVQMWAAVKGVREDLPPLPKSLRNHLDDDAWPVDEWERLGRPRE